MLTIPKMLRAYFRYDRRLLGELCRVAAGVIAESFRVLHGPPAAEPGLVICVRTFGNLLNFHPHLLVMATDGGFTPDGVFHSLPTLSLVPDPAPVREPFGPCPVARSRDRSYLNKHPGRAAAGGRSRGGGPQQGGDTMKTALSLTVVVVLLAAGAVHGADPAGIPAVKPGVKPGAKPQSSPPPAGASLAGRKQKPDITAARKGIIIGGEVGGAGGKFIPWGGATDISDVLPLPGTIGGDRCAFNVTYFEINSGAVATAPLYTNKLKLDGAAEVAINTNRQLNAAEQKAVTTQPYLTLGGHGLQLSLDEGSAVAETNEHNNVFSIRYKLGSCRTCDGLPDLVPAIPNPMTGTLVVKNGGACPAGPSKLLAMCKKDGHTGGGGGCADLPTSCAALYSDPAFPDAFVLSVPALAAGASFTHTVVCWGALVWAPGTYLFSFRADAAGTVAESNEGNNGATSSLTVP